MTERIQETFSFTAHSSRRVKAGFTAGRVSSDGGALLLREADRKIGLLGRLASCFQDKRQQEQVEHPLAEMLSQRIYGLALGYEDLNDHGQLRAGLHRVPVPDAQKLVVLAPGCRQGRVSREGREPALRGHFTRCR